MISPWAFIATAVCYFVFNTVMFSGIKAQGNMGTPRRGFAVLSFFINYAFFAAMSILQFNLMTNWLLICVIFTCEIKFTFRCSWGKALFSALFVAIIGLGANVLTRSLCAIVMDVPQNAFSNNSLSESNSKTIPVALGFLLASLFMYIQQVRFPRGEVVVVYNNARSRRFVLGMVALGYLYLCAILLFYYVDSNDLVLKVWPIKAAVSVYVSVSLSFYYAHRTASLIDRSERQRALEREVAERERESSKLQDMAQRDELTRCYTRAWVEHRVADLLAAGREVTLAFIDVNNLKVVNDEGGHERGDVYLVNVAAALDNALISSDDVLGRFGGDEFIVALPDVPAAEAVARLEEVQHRLRTKSFTEPCPFALSISFGVASSRPGDDVSSLVRCADKAMYKAKRAMKAKG